MCGLIVALVVVMWQLQQPASVQAQETTAFQLEHFDPQADPSTNLLNVAGSDVLKHLNLNAGVFFNYVNNQLILSHNDPEIGSQSLARHIVRADVVAALGLYDVFNLEFAMPMALYQDGDDLASLGRSGASIEGVSAGDLRVTPKLRLLDRRSFGGFGLALASPVYIPTGDTTTMQSEGNLRVEAKLIADWTHPWGFALMGNIGYQVRRRTLVQNLEIDDVVRWSVAGAVPLGMPSITAYVIGFGDLSAGEVLDPESRTPTDGLRTASPTELLSGLRYRSPWQLEVSAGAGVGFLRGLGSPDVRATFGLHWLPEFAPDTALRPVQDLGIRWYRALFVSAQPLGAPGSGGQLNLSPQRVFSVDVAQSGRLGDISTVIDASLVPRPDQSFTNAAPLTRIDTLVAVSLFDVTEVAVGVPTIIDTGDGAVYLDDMRLQLKGVGLDYETEDPPATQQVSQLASADKTSLPPTSDAPPPPDDTGFGFGLSLPMRLPTGDNASFSRGSLDLGTRGLFDMRFGLWTFHVNQGVAVRDPRRLGLSLQGLWDYGLGITKTLGSVPLQIAAEVSGERQFQDFLVYQDKARLDTSVGVRYQPDIGWQLSGQAQVELTDFLDPAVGVRLGVGYAPDIVFPDFCSTSEDAYTALDPCPDRDRDTVHIPTDTCPTAREDFDQFEDADGCPDADNDQDAILDSADACAMAAEDPDGFDDTDGCPDLDDDGDKIPDTADGCRLEAEDVDQFEDADGCPEADNDKDSFLDAADTCPVDPEDPDGFEDADGCPDTDNDKDLVLDAVDRCPDAPGLATWEGCLDRSIRIFFESQSAELLPEALPELDEMVAALAEPLIKQVEIQGHTDDRGTARRNRELSLRRVKAVKEYLIKKGVAEEKLITRGVGEDEPAVPIETPDGEELKGAELDEARAQNRRVRFVILE